MNWRKSSGPDLLPRHSPPGSLVPDPYISLLNAIQDTTLQHVMYWTVALASAFAEHEIWRNIQGFRFAAFGFADPDFEEDAFGILAYGAPIPGRKDEKILVEAGEAKFPVFVRRSYELYHAVPTEHPALGTAGCWAESFKPIIRGQVGLLTVKHVLQGAQPGSSIATTHGVGTVLDVAPDGVEAALIAPSGPVPRHRANLDWLHLVAPWTDVQFEGRQSGRIHTKVTSVHDTRGSLSPWTPIRIYLADRGMPGDSGALVEDGSSQGVGLYMGEIRDLSGRFEGVGQHLGQAAHSMNLNLYV